ILYLFHRWQDAKHETRNRLLIWIAFLFGLGAGNYLALLYYIPVIAIGVLWKRRSVIKDYKLIIISAAALFLGFCVHIYLPLRSLADPALDWGNPETLTGFIKVMNRERWGALIFSNLTLDFVLVWLDTFDFLRQLGPAALALALAGLFFAGRRNALLAFVLIACFYVYGIIMMLMQATTPALHQDLVYVSTYGMQEFHIPLYLIVTLFSGFGFHGVIQILNARKFFRADSGAVRITVTSLLVLLVITAYAVRLPECNLREYYQPYDYGQELLSRVPENGWVIPSNDSSFFVLSYLKFCKKQRPDICIITPSDYCRAVLKDMLSDPGSAVTSRRLAELVRGDQERFIEPILNQDNINKGSDPEIVFAKFPLEKGWERDLYPDGPLFRFDPQNHYSKEAQLRYWKQLLRKQAFALEPNSTADFRVNMVTLLHDHAWWHNKRSEYDAAKYLYGQALIYSPHVRPDILSGMADCLVSLEEFDEAYECCMKALGADQYNKRALNILGIIYVQRRQFDLALLCFRTVLKLYPDDKAAKENMEKALEERNGIGDLNIEH
ncbi:protein O-mannosyl-transferase family, partial [Verrucomicrobiota bacterium]